MDRFIQEILARRAAPGVLILDLENRILYSNEQALEMLSLLPDWDGAQQVPAEVHAVCREVRSPGSATAFGVIKESSRDGQQYSLRAFVLGSHGNDGASHVMVLMEKVIRNRQIDLKRARERFQLSKRETEVVGLVCQGLANKEISGAIFISELTVKDHLKNIMRKMGAGSRNEIIAALL